MKTCTNCGEEKLSELFEVDRRKKYGRGSRCKLCLYGDLKCIKCKVIIKYSKRSYFDKRVCVGCDGSELLVEDFIYQSPMAI